MYHRKRRQLLKAERRIKVKKHKFFAVGYAYTQKWPVVKNKRIK